MVIQPLPQTIGVSANLVKRKSPMSQLDKQMRLTEETLPVAFVSAKDGSFGFSFFE